MRILTISLLMLAILAVNASAETGYIELSGTSYAISTYNDSTGHIYLRRSLLSEDLPKVIVADPHSLVFEKEYLSPGRANNVTPIDNGASLLILLSNLNGIAEIRDGVLRQIAYSDGSTEHEYHFDRTPLTFVVDSQEQFAYMTSSTGLRLVITKIDLSTWQRTGPEVSFSSQNYFPGSISLAHDDSKLYVMRTSVARIDREWEGDLPPQFGGRKRFWKIEVIDTSNMTKLPSVEIDVQPSQILMGYDNRLFVVCRNLQGFDTPLFVIDTTDDSVTSIPFSGVSFSRMALDAVNKKLYCQAMVQEIDEYGYEFHRWSNMIYQIDIDNQYSYEIYTPANEDTIQIEIVPSNDPAYQCRLFALTRSRDKVYYMDIPTTP